MKRSFLLATVILLICAPAVLAVSYVTLPTDRDLVDQSQAIFIGVVEGSYVEVADGSGFETFYEFRVQKSLKGGLAANRIVRVASPGGDKGQFGSRTPGAAHFTSGERALVFLTGSDAKWTVTHMALGSFRFGTARDGKRLLVRDLSEVEAFDDGTRREKLRSEQGFLKFISDVTVGAPDVKEDYLVAGELSAETRGSLRPTVTSLADPKRYTQMSADSLPTPAGTYGVRWTPSVIAAGLAFHKQNAAHLSGAGDNGVSVIQTALASWTDDALSAVTLNYGGTTTQLPLATSGGNPAYNGFADGVNVIAYNAAIASAGVCNIVFFLGDAGGGYRQIIDADIRISSSVTNASLGLPSIMTHELGHAIGFRHSNASPLSPNDSATTCALPDDCVSNTNGAIMLWVVTNAGNGYTLQPWDQNAIRSVYPGAAPTFNPPTNVVASATGATTVQVSWTAASGTPPGRYNVYRTANVSTPFGIVGNTTFTTFSDTTASADTSYLYMVRSADAGGGNESANSNSDLATTVIFTNPITAGVSTVMAVDATQLRTAIDKVRALGNIGPASYAADPTITAGVTTIMAAHVTDMRTFLNAGRTSVGMPTISFTNTLTPGSTPISAIDFNELRAGVQ